MKSVQIRSLFSRIRTEYEIEKTPYLDTFHVVCEQQFDNFSHTWWNIQVLEKTQLTFLREIKPYGVYRNMKGFILEEILKDKDGNQHCLPFC